MENRGIRRCLKSEIKEFDKNIGYKCPFKVCLKTNKYEFVANREKRFLITGQDVPADFIKETQKLVADSCGRKITATQALQIIQSWLEFADILVRLNQLSGASNKQ